MMIEGNMLVNTVLYVMIGLIAGMISGVIGIGGGVVIVPSLVFLFGMTQHQAQGTSLAVMVLPIGILAAWAYYNKGFIDIKIAAMIAVGFFLGGLLGGRIAVNLPSAVLSKIFGVVLLLIAIKMILSSK